MGTVFKSTSLHLDYPVQGLTTLSIDTPIRPTISWHGDLGLSVCILMLKSTRKPVFTESELGLRI